jgi:hypothetical protein
MTPAGPIAGAGPPGLDLSRAVAFSAGGDGGRRRLEGCLPVIADELTSVLAFHGRHAFVLGRLTRRSQHHFGCPKNANGFQKNAIVCSLITKLNISGSSHERGWIYPTPVESSMSCVLAFIFHRGVSTLLL